MNFKKLLEFTCVALLAVVFVYAGALKAIDIESFASSVANYKLLSHRWNFAVAALLPPVEILAGLAILLPSTRRPSALLIAIMNLVFIGLLASAAYRGLDIDCGCFSTGDGDVVTPIEAIFRDIFLFVAAMYVYITSSKK